MPVLDMPLKELKHYKGISPKPRDFEDYWDSALARMKALGTSFTLSPSTFKAPGIEAFDMWFTGVDNAKIYVKYMRPARQEKPAPALLQFHGYSMNSGDWLDKYAYASAGFHIFAMDCRGQGGKSEDAGGIKGTTLNGHIIRGIDDDPKNLLFKKIFLDTAQLASIVMDLDAVDETRIGVFGGSQGGALTIACAALVPEIKKAAPVYPFLSDYRRVWEMDMAERAYAELKDYFRRFDPNHMREDEIFMKLGYIDIQNLAHRIKADVLWACGLMDDVCPPSTQFAAYNKLKCSREMVLFHDFGHEWLPGFGDQTFEFMSDLLD